MWLEAAAVGLAVTLGESSRGMVRVGQGLCATLDANQ